MLFHREICRAGSLALSVVAVFSVAACSRTAHAVGSQSALPPNRSTFISYAQMDAEFQAEKSRLSLPPEVNWPADAEKLGPDDKYGLGYGTSQADAFWYCAWSADWLKARDGSPGEAGKALATLMTIRGLELYKVGDDPATQKLTDDELRAAKAGDPSLLARDVAANC